MNKRFWTLRYTLLNVTYFVAFCTIHALAAVYLLDKGFTDTFRYVHGDVKNVYSWWAQRIRTSKTNNSGWRIDYFLVSDRIRDRVKRSEMMDSGPRQDHTPILLEIDL